MTRTVLVTGATGTVGSSLLSALSDRDATVRAAARSPPGDGPADEWATFDFERPETWGVALSGVDARFLFRPPQLSRVGPIREFVDARDVASVAAAALTGPGHGDVAYDPTGPTALTYDEVAAVASEVVGCPIEYTNPSLPGFLVRERRRGRSLGFSLVMAGIYTTARLGLAGRVTDDVEHVLDRPPRDVRTFFEDYRAELTAA